MEWGIITNVIKQENYPRVLIVVMGRINAVDSANNGLLLRSIFGRLPRQNLAQIFSGGDNGDNGFFDRYYELGPKDRRLGRLFFRLKHEGLTNIVLEKKSDSSSKQKTSIIKSSLISFGMKMLMGSGLYELIFRPRMSQDMVSWVKEFHPEIIFAQGYNLAFTWLPMILANYFQIPIAYFPGDDWPANRYRPEFDNSTFFSRISRQVVIKASTRLVKMSKIKIANSTFMQEEYKKRYGQDFNILMMGDDFDRINTIQPIRAVDSSKSWIVCTGVFNQNRLPLLSDLNDACKVLSTRGHKIHTTVFPVNDLSEMSEYINRFPQIDFQQCPLNDGLMATLRGADILFLPERFDETSKLIQVSISTKAHLFMFAGKPIVVYSDSITGIAKYAKNKGWAIVVDKRDPTALADAFEEILSNKLLCNNLIDRSHQVALENHDLKTIQETFADLLISAVCR